MSILDSYKIVIDTINSGERSTNEKELLISGVPSHIQYYVLAVRWDSLYQIPEEMLNVVYQNINICVRLCVKLGETNSHLENVISKDPRGAYEYSKNFLGGRFPLGEPSIFKDPEIRKLYLEYIKN